MKTTIIVRPGVFYKFADEMTGDAEDQHIPQTALDMWEKFKGKRMTEIELWGDLVVELSPRNRRTMWHVFLEYRCLLIDAGLLTMQLDSLQFDHIFMLGQVMPLVDKLGFTFSGKMMTFDASKIKKVDDEEI